MANIFYQSELYLSLQHHQSDDSHFSTIYFGLICAFRQTVYTGHPNLNKATSGNGEGAGDNTREWTSF